MLHVAGSHTVRKNEIQAATYLVSENRELTAEPTIKFDMGVNVKVLDLATKPEEDLYHVYISYRETGEETA